MMDDTEISALEEGDYDALNDETFGNETEEFKWEPSLEYLEEDGLFNRQTPKQEASKSTASGPYEFDDFGNENELEASISRLVLDDFDEDTESVGDRIIKRTSTVPYFTPMQVVNKHYSWLAGQESPGDSSLLVGSSVWSMHPTPPPQPVQTSKSLISEKQSTNSSSYFVQDEKIVKQNKQEEAQKYLLQKMKMNSFSSPDESLSTLTPMGRGGPRNPNIKTVDEIETEMLGHFQPKSALPPDTATKMGQAEMTVEELEIMFQTVHALDRVHEIETSKLSPYTSTSQPIRPSVREIYDRQTQLLKSRNFDTQDNHGPRQSTSNSFSMEPSLGRGSIFPRPMGYPPHGRGRGHTLQNMMPPGMHSLPPYFHVEMGLRHMNMPRFRPQFNNGPPPNRSPQGPRPFWQNSPYDMHGRTPRGHWDEFRANGMLGRDVDLFSGLMTEKDKQRLRNIQIIQLQNDHPYTADYYFQMKYLKSLKIDEKFRRDYICFMKLYPVNGTEHTRNSYQPTHFENSLGKLQAVSALAPKKALDSGIVTADNENKWRSPSRSLLLVIERMYNKVLRVEEADFRATLRNSDESFFQYREEDLESTLKTLNTIGMEVVSKYTKGQVLLCRILALTKPEIRHELFIYIVTNLSAWFKGKTEKAETKLVYECLRKALLSTSLMEFISILAILDPYSDSVKAMYNSKVGSSFLMCVLHQAEMFYRTQNYFNSEAEGDVPDIIDEPSSIRASEILTVIAKGESIVPLQVFPSLMQLAGRLELYHLIRTSTSGENSVLDSRLAYFVKEGATIFTE